MCVVSVMIVMGVALVASVVSVASVATVAGFSIVIVVCFFFPFNSLLCLQVGLGGRNRTTQVPGYLDIKLRMDGKTAA